MMITEHEHTNRCWWNPDQARWVCRSATDTPLVDTRDMIVVHTAMLREFRLAPAAVRRTQVGDRKQATAVAAHLTFLCDMLHHHHAGEDELLWPKLRERVPASAVQVLDDAEAQHESIDAALTRTARLRDTWATGPTDPAREALAASLDELHAVLSTHLDLEERALLPLAAAELTADEWHAAGEAGAKSMSKPELALAFGMFAYEGDPGVLRDMLRAAPAVPRMLLPHVAPRIYARRARRIHGTTRP